MNKFIRNMRYDIPLYIVLSLTSWLPDNSIFLRLRGSLIRPFLGDCGRNLVVARDVTFFNPSNIHFGNDVFVGKGAWFMAGESITIHDEVLIAPYCVIVSGQHTMSQGSYRFGKPIHEPIEIKRGSGLGAHVVVNAGVVIGEGTLVGAGGVVTRSLPDYVIAAGQPAKVIRENTSDVTNVAMVDVTMHG